MAKKKKSLKKFEIVLLVLVVLGVFFLLWVCPKASPE